MSMTTQYKYNQQEGRIYLNKEKPDPCEWEGGEESHYYKNLLADYNTRPSYPVSPNDWEDGKILLEGVDFELKKEWIMTGRKDEYDGSMDKYQQSTAIPIPAVEKNKRVMKRITLCGSTKFKKEFEQVNKLLTLQGNVVYTVSCFGHSDNIQFTKEEKELLDFVHKRKIDNSDGILVINVNGYIGESTKSEIEHAKKTGKYVEYLSDRCDIIDWLQAALVESKPDEKVVLGEWQLCPKCLGGGRAMNMNNFIPTTMDICDVCNGAKVLARPILNAPPQPLTGTTPSSGANSSFNSGNEK